MKPLSPSLIIALTITHVTQIMNVLAPSPIRSTATDGFIAKTQRNRLLHTDTRKADGRSG